MYNAVLPTISKNKGKDEVKNDVINGDDPANQDTIRNAMFDVNEDE